MTRLCLLTVALFIAAPLWAQPPGTWAPTGNLDQARAGHTATLLANGKVLIAGGKGATAEIYDLTTGQYTPLPVNLPTPVWGHTATSLPDGTVLLLGGIGASGQPVRDAQLYDPTASPFTLLSPMGAARSRHSATPLSNGTVLIGGGTDGVSPLGVLEVYDSVTRNFSPAVSALATARQDHIASLLPDGRILFVGGSNASAPLNSAELYDPTNGQITSAGPLSVARTLASASLLLNDSVLVAGGQDAQNNDLNSAEVYDSATNTFLPLQSLMTTARSGHMGLSLLDNGKVLIAGGTSGGKLLASVEVSDPALGKFWDAGSVESLSTGRELFGANFFAMPYTGTLLASGGLDSTHTPFASSELFFYPTLRSDTSDYPPGDIVTLMGEGWLPNEAVNITLQQSSGDPDTTLNATADASGAFTNNQFMTAADRSDIGVRFLATAVGQKSN